jgi:hypothetical protein
MSFLHAAVERPCKKRDHPFEAGLRHRTGFRRPRQERWSLTFADVKRTSRSRLFL